MKIVFLIVLILVSSNDNDVSPRTCLQTLCQLAAMPVKAWRGSVNGGFVGRSGGNFEPNYELTSDISCSAVRFWDALDKEIATALQPFGARLRGIVVLESVCCELKFDLLGW